MALVIESGHTKPVWFEEVKRASDRIFIKEICLVWSHHQGSGKIISFSVTFGGNGYLFPLNTEVFTWELGVVEESEFLSPSCFSWGSFRYRK